MRALCRQGGILPARGARALPCLLPLVLVVGSSPAAHTSRSDIGSDRGEVKGDEGSLTFAVQSKGLYPYLVDDAGAWTTRNDVRHARAHRHTARASRGAADEAAAPSAEASPSTPPASVTATPADSARRVATSKGFGWCA